jgi:hypothetical protein
MQWSNIVSLDENKPHLLPSGMTFFRVNESHVGKWNVLVNKFVLFIQVYNPDSLTMITACLSDNNKVIIVAMPGPDKFVHEQHNELALRLAAAVADGCIPRGDH